jgi:signal transduction histidine kinase
MYEARLPSRMRSSNDIAVRSAVGFALVTAITVIAVVASTLLSRHAADERERITSRYQEDVANAARVQSDAERIVAAGRGYLLENSPALQKRLDDAREDLDIVLGYLDRDDSMATERDLQELVRRTATRYKDRLDELIRATPASEGRASLARTLRDDLLPLREDLDTSVEELVAHKRHLQEQAVVKAAALARRTIWGTVWLGLVSLALSIALAWRFTRQLADIYHLERDSSRKAAAALDAKEELLRIVAHDLRSPLTSIALRAEGMARRHADDDIRRPAAAIRSTCGRMADLIESLVQAANIEAGNLVISICSFRVDDLVRAVVDTFAPAAEEAGVNLVPRIEPAGLEIDADRGRLLQVLSNLVGNALKFTKAGGVVGISATAGTDAIVLEVNDSGRGIAAEDVPHVFERYWKRDTDSSRGAGLGLYITKALVEAHGGHITVESALGRGSAFRIELPTSAARRLHPTDTLAMGAPRAHEGRALRHAWPTPVSPPRTN